MQLTLADDDPTRRTVAGLDAVQLYQLGQFRQARSRFETLALAADTRDLALSYIALIDRALAEAGGAGWTLNLPADGPVLWEADWIRMLFGPVVTAEVIDDRTGLAADRSIIVDFALTAAKDAYYQRNFEHGVRQVLVHLSDEYYADSTLAYRWCQRVYRNYWSPAMVGLGGVCFFPLGYKTGFARPNEAPRPAAERAYVWSFVGDPGKHTRAVMRRYMRGVPGGFEHLISGWDSADSLSTEDYRRVLDQSLFVPCPAGGANLDSYRVYEALEAGCIPIVTDRPGYAYFDRLLPGHPLPVISDWSQAPGLIEALVAGGECERLRQTCRAWWSAHKAQLIDQVRADLG